MLTHDEVSGAVILAGRTDRSAVVLVAEFFRIGIVFGTRSYANIARSIRRLFRRHTDWIAAGQFTRNIDIFVGRQIDVVICTLFFVATDVYIARNYECIAIEMHTTTVACRSISGDAATVQHKCAFTVLKTNAAAITGCSVTGNFRRA